MVRGNWQHRVERTIERRNKAKYEKQKIKDRRQHKLNVQEFIRFLDKIQQQNVYNDTGQLQQTGDILIPGTASTNPTTVKNSNTNLRRLLSLLSSNGGSQQQQKKVDHTTITLHLWTDRMAVNNNDYTNEDDEIDDDDMKNLDEDDDENSSIASSTTSNNRKNNRRDKKRSQSLCDSDNSATPKTPARRNRSMSTSAASENDNEQNSDEEEAQRNSSSMKKQHHLGRNRSNSTPEQRKTGKKAVHPRSNQKHKKDKNVIDDPSNVHDDDGEPLCISEYKTQQLYMSRSFFFREKYDNDEFNNTNNNSKKNRACNSSTNRSSGGKLPIVSSPSSMVLSAAVTSIPMMKSLFSIVTMNGTSCTAEAIQRLSDAEDAVKLSMAQSGSSTAKPPVDDTDAFTHPGGTNEGAMEMLFYLPCTLNVSLGNNKEKDRECSAPSLLFSSQITDILAQKQINYVNIAFAVISDVIVFDRNRDGLLYPNEESFWLTVFNEKDPTDIEGTASIRRNRNGSIDYGTKTAKNKSELQELSNDGQKNELIRDLPGAILEHILTFVPDRCVGSASRVCKPWNHEIGKNSSNLWKHLLQRRNWPIIVHNVPNAVKSLHHDKNSIEDSQQQNPHTHETIHRDTFIRHYTAIRDMLAIRYGCCNGLLQSNNTSTSARRHVQQQRKRCTELEMTYHDFTTRKFSPQYPNGCVSVQVWSKNRILAAYGFDCSLRLFEADERYGSYNEITCREIVCQKIDPYRNTKKRTCTLVSMGLDDECIGCLSRVVSDSIGVHVRAYILIIMRRENFLLGESSSCGGEKDPNANTPDFDSAVDVIDIGEAVINFLLSSDHVDQRLLAVLDFISDGGALGEIEVLTSHSIASVGYGRFMVEVSIFLPNAINDDDSDDFDAYDVDNDEENPRMRFIDRRLILFSTRIGAIVWMGDSNLLSQPVLRPHNDNIILSSYRRCEVPNGRHKMCYLAASSNLTSSIVVYEIEYSGTFRKVSLDIGEVSCMVRNEIESKGWRIVGNEYMLIAPTDVMVTYILTREEYGIEVCRSILVFYPHNPSYDQPSYEIVSLPHGVEVKSLTCVRDDHIYLLCCVESSISSNTPIAEPLDRAIHVVVDDEVDDDEDDTDSSNESDDDSDIEDNLDNGQHDVPHDTHNNHRPTRTSLVSIVYHIPTRQEIGQIEVINDANFNDLCIPVLPSHCDETVGVGLAWKGIVMTGADVRSVRSTYDKQQQQTNSGGVSCRANSVNNGVYQSITITGNDTAASKKQQQKKQKKNSGKKDGFARGMSLRG
jgi:F-box domain